MTTVDDNLLAVKLRSAKSGSKSAGGHLDMDAAKQRTAFENAFADAGKKKQPQIAIDGKATAETTPRANIAIAQKLTAGAVQTTSPLNEAADIKGNPETSAKQEIDAKAGVEAEAKVDAKIDTTAEAKVESEVKAKFEAETRAEVRAAARAEARAKVEERLEADADANIDVRATRETEALSGPDADSMTTISSDDAPIDVKSIHSESAGTPEKPSAKLALEEAAVSHAGKAAAKKDEPVAAAPSTSRSKAAPSDVSTSSILSTLSTLAAVEPQPDAEALPVVEAKPELKTSDDVLPRPAPALSILETAKQELPPARSQQSGTDVAVGVTKKADVSVARTVVDPIRSQSVAPEKVTEAGTAVIKAEDLKPELAPLPQSTDDVTPVATAPVPASTTTVAADISQLLTLLSPEPQPVADDTNAAAKLENTPTMSEFHALADRAGMAVAVPREERVAKPETAGSAAQTTDKAAPAAEKASALAEKAPVSTDRGDANTTASADTDQIFRFARADGKGQTVSMTVNPESEKVAAKNDVSAVSPKAETVTVLEARRYLGLAPASNAAAVTSQISSNPEWAKALQSAADVSGTPGQPATGKVLNTLKIQMHPIDLGTVTATLRLKEEELHVELKVETGGAFRQLSDDQNDIVKALRSQGFAVDQVNIVFNAPDSSGSTTQQQAQPQTAQQGREASADGSAQGRGQRNDNGSQQQNDGRWTGNEGTSDPSSGADASRTGDVYM